MSIFGNNSNSNAAGNDDPTQAFLADLAKSQNQAKPAAASRKASEHWLNVGLVVPGFGEDGSDVFISFGGIALDDLKPIEVKGSNPNWVRLQQAKAQLQQLVLTQAGKLQPGERMPLKLTCEVSRAAKPAQTAEPGGATATAVNDAFAGIAG